MIFDNYDKNDERLASGETKGREASEGAQASVGGAQASGGGAVFVPHGYQERAIGFVCDVPFCGLFLDMGLGKTVCTLTAVARLIGWGEVRRVLVIAPKKVAECTWAAEASKWAHLRGLRVSVVLGDARRRAAALAADADVFVTSRDLFVKVAAACTAADGGGWRFDMVVIDELTSFKTPGSKRFRAFRRLRPLMARVVGLTGTPTPNGLKDLYGQLFCLDMGARLGRTQRAFFGRWFNVYERNHVTLSVTPRAGAEGEILAAIGDICLTMRAADFLQLPALIERGVVCRFSDAELASYRRFARERVLEAEAGGVAVADNAAALTGKLCQFANGAVYESEVPGLCGGGAGGRAYMETSGAKVAALTALVARAQAAGEAVLVFYQFKHDVERCTAALMAEDAGLRVGVYGGAADLEKWNAGGFDVLFAHPASVCYGLNMQAGGHVVAWFGTGWNCELYAQGNARLYRQGQSAPVVVYRLVVAGTADERALAAVDGKVNAQEAMLEALAFFR